MAIVLGANPNLISNPKVTNGSATIGGFVNEPVDQTTGRQAPLAAGVTATTGGNGGGGSVVNNSSYVGPSAAQIAETNRINTLINGYNQRQSSYQAAGDQQAGDVGNTYDANNRSFITTLANGEDDINSGLTNNALNLRRSISSIASGVRQGLRSTGVSLANANALDSGAADDAARAWARVGGGQVTDANSQAADKNTELQESQVKLNRSKDDTLAGFNAYRNAETGRLGNTLQDELQGLTTEAQGANTGFSANMNIKNQVVNALVDRLNQIDAARNSRIAGIRQLTPDEINAAAAAQDAAGQAGTNPFTVTDPNVSNTIGDSGAAISQLPIYTRKKTV